MPRGDNLSVAERQNGLNNQIAQWQRPNEPFAQTRERFFAWFARLGQRESELPRPYNWAFWQRYETPSDAPAWAHRWECRIWKALGPLDWPMSEFDTIDRMVKKYLESESS